MTTTADMREPLFGDAVKPLQRGWLWLCLIYPLATLISIAATNVLLILTTIGFLIFRKPIVVKPARTTILLISFYLGWTLVAVIFSPYNSNWSSWFEERSTFLALIPGLVIGSNLGWFKKIMGIISIYLIVISAYAGLQYFIGYDIIRMEEIRSFRENFRAIGLQNNALTFAGLIGLTAPIAMGIGTGRVWRSGVLAVATSVAVISAIARAVYLGLLGSAALFFISGSRRLRMAGIILAIALLILPRTIFIATGERLTTGDKTRLNLWQSAINIIAHYPITGVGEDNWNEAFADYGVDYDQYNTTAHAHHDYLTAALENGIIGLVLLLILWGYIIIRLIMSAFGPRGPDRDLRLGMLAAFAVILFGGFFQNYQTDAEVALLLWFLVGAAMQMVGRTVTEEGRSAS